MAEVISTVEKEAIFDKTFECPICNREIKAKTIKTGKCKLESTDEDLRPVYHNIDSLKYDVVFCPHCGYATLKKFFDEPILPVQKKNLTEKVCNNFKGTGKEPAAYTYEESIRRHKFALLCSMVKEAKLSEQAYTCLKIAWLYRGERELYIREGAVNQEEQAKLWNEEQAYITKAYHGFSEAYIKEDFPMCGMDEVTYSYLLADLAYKTEHIKEARRWISSVISSPSASQRVKEKARDLKDVIQSTHGEEE
ncbi:MAG: DUF2225 domain-containing protein [bacterium]|nr:DUF2225 domain-containing protein [bacterium]